MKFWLAAALALTLIGSPGLAGDAITFGPPPRLAITSDEFASQQKSPEFPKIKAAKLSAGDALVTAPVLIPDREGDWIFYYACLADGTTLKPVGNPRGREVQHDHQCAKCQKVYNDARTVAAYRTQLHYNAERAAQTLGEAYLYSGDEKYAKEAQRILLTYADDYPTYPQRHDRWGHSGMLAPLGGRRYAQSLDEAVGVIALAKAYDLTRTSPIWTDAQRKHVEAVLFRTVADTLLWFNQGINNHQTWYNAGLMAIASVLADEQLVRKVLTMPGGFEFQLQRSITSDGLWYEGTMAYHHYALQAMLEIVEAGRRIGLKLQDEAQFRAMFEAPLKYAYPNGQFPAINDSDPGNIDGFAAKFLWAWETWRDPVFARAYARDDAAKLKSLLGDDAKISPALAIKSANLAGAGLVAMRRGGGDSATCLFVDYGEHGGGHGHPDKLNICLYALGREWVLDPGRLTYSHAEHLSWCKQTVAHNTVVIDGKSQEATTGRCLMFLETNDCVETVVESTGAYPDTTLRRHLWLNDEMLVDVFEVASSTPHRIDWIIHAISATLTPADAIGAGNSDSPGTENGYQHLSDALRWTIASDSRWDFKDANGKLLRMWLVRSETGPESIFTANGIGYSTDQRVPCLLRQRNAKTTRFISVIDLSGAGQFVKSVRWDESNQRLTVDSKKGSMSRTFDTTQPSTPPQP